MIGFEATRLHQQWVDQRRLYTPYVRARLDAAAEVTRRQYDEALLSGRPITADQRPSIGCNIKWKPGNEPNYFSAGGVK